MRISRWQKIIAPLLLSLLLIVTACGAAKEPSRWDQAQQQSTQSKTKLQPATAPGTQSQVPGVPNQAPTGKAVEGKSFNKFFPSSENGLDRVYTQEKPGFVQAKLKKGGKELALLSINDLATNPSGIEKYKTSSQTIAGYPATTQGSTMTSILVGKRYQVKVESRDPSFTASDREAWLQKFDLGSLASLK